jgi:acyl-CoA-binding protein
VAQPPVPGSSTAKSQALAGSILFSHSPTPMDLQQQFDAAVQQVNNLSDATAAQHMTELYGLYKQATEGDENMKSGEVDPDAADQASGPAGLSQAQWESWDKYKGLSEEDAKRQYVAKVAEITGAGADGTDADLVPTDALTNAPEAPPTLLIAEKENDTLSRQAHFSPGQSTGGLRGDITGGAPYGGEDEVPTPLLLQWG